jgi:hypothetical protein
LAEEENRSRQNQDSMIERLSQIVASRIGIMLQHSKLISSRDEWKYKAVQRAYEIRELKKTRKRLKEKIAELKVQSQTTQQTTECDKKNR